MINKYYLNIGTNLEMIILKNNTNNNILFIYDNKELKYFYFILKKHKNIIIENSKSICLNYTKFNTQNVKLAISNIENFIWTLNFGFFLKIKFKGKGYSFKKVKNIIKYNFYFSHLNIVKIITSKLKKLGKYKYILIGKDFKILKKTTSKIAKIRFIDVYTKRGIRLSKQKLNSRKGKISAYTKKTN